MSVKTPNYVTNEDCEYSVDKGWSKKVLEKNTFVKPIEEPYLPAHLKDSIDYKFWNREKETYVYCSKGIILIPRKVIREV